MGDAHEVPLASVGMLREITDGHAIAQLLAEPLLTRAEIAARTGISKPTVSESIRRLVEAGIVTPAGAQQGKRGPAGLFYMLTDDVGYALAVDAGPDGLIAQTYDIRGEPIQEIRRATPSPVTGSVLNPLLRELVCDILDQRRGPLRGAALSVAGPIDRHTGRLVRLPNSPYLVDELDARGLLSDLLGSVLRVDNDVNWAALAEHRVGNAADLTDFFYCHLGYGIGGAVVRGGQPDPGSAGLAGEIAYVLTHAPGGGTCRLVECFGQLGLLQEGGPAIDVGRLARVLSDDSDARAVAVVDAVAGALASVSALLNPAAVIIGGPWGSHPAFVERVGGRLASLAAIPTQVRPAHVGATAPLIGAADTAVRLAQASLTGNAASGARTVT